MSKTWRIPSIIEPVDSICVQIQVPNESIYIETFWGALEALCKAWNYDYTQQHHGSQVAYVWQSRIDNAAELVRIGENCAMAIDCNDIENCLSTSPIIAAIQADIVSLQNTDVNLQSQISSNDVDIASLQTDVNQIKTVDIPQINLTLSDHEDRIAVNEANLAQNNGILSDHEQRIIALENTQISGGGRGFEFSEYTHFIATDINNTLTDAWETFAVVPHTFTYPNALIIAECKVQSTAASRIAKIRTSVGLQAGIRESWTQETIAQSIQVNEKFSNIPVNQQISIFLDFSSDGSPGTARIVDNQYAQIAIWEFDDVPIVLSDIVTFEANTRPYSLLPNQVGVVASGGNPSLALKASNLAITEFIGIRTNNTDTQVDDLSLDMFLSDKNPLRLRIYIDNILEYDQPLDFVGQSGVWFNHRVSDYSAIFPIVGTQIDVEIYNANGGTVADVRMDNIHPETS